MLRNYLKYKAYRAKWNLAAKVVPQYPIHVDFEVSSICNLKCSFCPHSEKTHDFERKFMDIDLFKKCIDEIAGKVPAVKFNLRGESTLHPDFDLFLKYTHKKFIDTRINTNGQYKNPAISMWMVKYCTDISFSVDAFYPETYKNIRKGGNFDLLNKNILDVIKFIKKWKKTKLTLSFTVTEENKEEIEVFQTYWKAHYKKINFFIRPAMDRINKTFMRGDKKAIGRKDCVMPNRRLTVTSDGRISYCCLLWHNADYLGEVRTNNVLDFWNNDKINSIRWKLKNLEFKALPIMCQECGSAESYEWGN